MTDIRCALAGHCYVYTRSSQSNNVWNISDYDIIGVQITEYLMFPSVETQFRQTNKLMITSERQ